MKNKLLSILLLAVICIGALTSCDILFGGVASDGKVSVVVENSDGSFTLCEANLREVENKNEGAKGILEHLRDIGELQLEMVDGGYGAYVTAVGSIKESSADGMYVIVYTSVASDSYDGAPTVDYNGITLYQAGLGLSGMSVEEGTVILFRLEKSPY